MSTQEERIVALERAKREHQAILQNFGHEITAVKGLISTQANRTQELKEDMTTSFKQLAVYQMKTERQIDERFSQVDERFNQVDERFSQIDERFSQVDERFNQVDERFNRMDERFNRMDERFNQVEATITVVKDELTTKATKEDLAAMEGRILGAFQQLVTMIGGQRFLTE